MDSVVGNIAVTQISRFRSLPLHHSLDPSVSIRKVSAIHGRLFSAVSMEFLLSRLAGVTARSMPSSDSGEKPLESPDP
jgi:hypothetical protein